MKFKISILLGLLCFTFAFAALSETVSAQETLIWTAWVYSDGSPTTSPVLEDGRQYRIVAKEVWYYNYAARLGADAQYYTTDPSPSMIWTNNFTAPDGHSFLQINEQDVYWGPFSNYETGHTYTIDYTGTGAPISFRIVDWMDLDYTNNYCHLPVEIWELPYVEEGFSPGYWGHQFKAYFKENGGGSPQESWDDLVTWTAAINAYYGLEPPAFDGYELPPVSSLLADSDLVFEPHDAYTIFSNKNDWQGVWLGLANWYNWAAGYGVYWDLD